MNQHRWSESKGFITRLVRFLSPEMLSHQEVKILTGQAAL